MAAACLLATSNILAHDFVVNGIYYNIFSAQTVQVTYNGGYSIMYNEYTGKVTIPDSVKYNGTTYLVTSIGYEAFNKCDKLTSVTIPNSVTSIERDAFANCPALTSIEIPNSVEIIGSGAFDGTAWYNSQPEGLVYAGKVLYKYKGTMPANTSITIEEGTLGITGSAFSNCSGLTSIEIPNSVTNIGSNAFNGTAWYNNQPNGVIYAGKVLYKYKGTMPANTSITIEEGTWGIAGYAFSGCSGLTSIEIPNSVTNIGAEAFRNCTGLKSIEIPSNVTRIDEKAFSYCSSLTEVIFLKCATSIGNWAFNGCKGLTSIHFAYSVTSIGEWAFYNCTSLKDVTIQNGVACIGECAFTDCSQLENVEILSSVKIIRDNAFDGCKGLTSVTIPSTVTAIGDWAFEGCTALTDLHIDNGTSPLSLGHNFDSNTNKYHGLFKDCPLKKVHIGRELNFENTERYGYSPFYNKNIDTLTISKVQSKNLRFGNNTKHIELLDINGNHYNEVPSNLASASTLYYFNTPYNIGDYKDITSYLKNHLKCQAKMTILGEIQSTLGSISVTLNNDLVLPMSIIHNGNVAIFDPVRINGKAIKKDSSGTYTENGLVFNTPYPVELTYVYKKKSYKTETNIYTKAITPTTSSSTTFTTATIWFNMGDTIGLNKTIDEIGVYFGGSLIPAKKEGDHLDLPYRVDFKDLRPKQSYSYQIYFKIDSTTHYVTSNYFETQHPITYINNYTTTPTTINLEITGTYSNEYLSPTEIGVLFNGKEYLADDELNVFIDGLTPGTTYTVYPYVKYEEYKYTTDFGTLEYDTFYGTTMNITTKDVPRVSIANLTTTQTTAILKIAGTYSDDYLSPIEVGVNVNGRYYVADDKFNVLVDGLTPSTTYTLQPYVKYENYGIYYGTSNTITTSSITVDCNVTATTATTISLKGTHDVGDATLLENGFVDGEFNSENMTLTGLDPDTEYSFTYYVTTEEAGRIEKQVTVRTEPLTFNTLKAKATSNTKAIICAEANIANEEAGTGFEWRRIDAPDLVPSELVGCAIHEGVMEGALHNLSANTYYKYRPYYCSATGNYYYGEWIGFGTADAYVYFTPTIHTYTSTKKDVNSVRLNGYVLAGSDNIKEQGFEYWPVGKVQAAPSRSGDSRNVTKVAASGQRMSAVIEDLEYGTVYACRAYVITESEIFYGEEITFETSYPTGIDDVYEKEDEASIRVMGNTIVVSGHKPGDKVLVYTMHGAVIYNGTADEEITLESGMYIVEVGNTTKKVRIR